MTRRIHLDRDAVDHDWSGVAREFPTIERVFAPPGSAVVALDVDAWRSAEFEPQSLDRLFGDAAGGVADALSIEGDADPQLVLQLLTRLQGGIDRRNLASGTALFERVLGLHRSLHDCSMPLVRADFNHARDVWQWVLRLEPRAGAPVQLAALFHDIERLVSEAERRVEHLAGDYQAFKDAHARDGASLTRRCLRMAGCDDEEIRVVCRLVASHERPGAEADLALLNDADALSFFSLNSAGFVDYYGLEHARRKVAYSLGRMSTRARARLGTLRLRADVEALVRQQLEADAAVHAGGGV